MERNSLKGYPREHPKSRSPPTDISGKRPLIWYPYVNLICNSCLICSTSLSCRPFTDAQFKLKTRFNEQNELTVLGLGGIDNMRLNTKATYEDNEYILSYLPKIKQETFTLGGRLSSLCRCTCAVSGSQSQLSEQPQHQIPSE